MRNYPEENVDLTREDPPEGASLPFLKGILTGLRAVFKSMSERSSRRDVVVDHARELSRDVRDLIIKADQQLKPEPK